MRIFSVVMFFIASASIHFSLNLYQENRLLQLNHQIQNEQLFDYHNDIVKLASHKTYEEGVRDGVLNRENERYTAGYHAAMEQMALPKNPTDIIASGGE